MVILLLLAWSVVAVVLATLLARVLAARDAGGGRADEVVAAVPEGVLSSRAVALPAAPSRA